MEKVINRARILLAYLSPRDIILAISVDEDRETAFLATKAALILGPPKEVSK